MPRGRIDICRPPRGRLTCRAMKKAAVPSPTSPSAAPALGLGLDAGGTQTRWALAIAPSGKIVAEGQVAGISGTQLAGEDGRAELLRTLQALAAELMAHGRPGRLLAGITGLPDGDTAGIA